LNLVSLKNGLRIAKALGVDPWELLAIGDAAKKRRSDLRLK